MIWDPGPGPDQMPQSGCCGDSAALIAAPPFLWIRRVFKSDKRYPANPNPYECCGHESAFLIYPLALLVVWQKKRRRSPP